MLSVTQRIADELAVNEPQVIAAVGLLDEGATVPFISRYRKEVTGGLDDSQLRQLEDRLRYLRELDERRDAVLKVLMNRASSQPNSRPRFCRPIQKIVSKIYTFPTNRNVVPRRRLQEKQGWSHWLRICLRIPR